MGLIKIAWWLFTDHVLVALCGMVWLAVFLTFAMYLYTYVSYYRKGLTDNAYYLSYLDLEEHARKVALLFIVFLVISMVIAETEPMFLESVLKGSVIGAFIFPAIYMYYSDETRFAFGTGKASPAHR